MREDGQAVDDALYSLAMGPDTRVRLMNLALLEMCATTPLHATKAGKHKTVPS